MDINRIESIINRLMTATCKQNARQLSLWLNPKFPDYITICKKRSTIDLDLIISRCELEGINPAYIIFGIKQEEQKQDSQRDLISCQKRIKELEEYIEELRSDKDFLKEELRKTQPLTMQLGKIPDSPETKSREIEGLITASKASGDP
jgi:hypothetical protein